MPTIDTVGADALQLSVAARAVLVERLISTLDAEPDPAVEDAWGAAISRRLAEIEQGVVERIPGPQALMSLRAEFS